VASKAGRGRASFDGDGRAVVESWTDIRLSFFLVLSVKSLTSVTIRSELYSFYPKLPSCAAVGPETMVEIKKVRRESWSGMRDGPCERSRRREIKGRVLNVQDKGRGQE
jgi:hypothetical protein